MFQWLRRVLGSSPREGLFPPGIPPEVLKLLQNSEPTEEQGSCLLAAGPSVELTLHWMGLKPFGELHSFSCGAKLLKVQLNYCDSHTSDHGSRRNNFAVETSYVPDLDPGPLKSGLPLRLTPHGEAWALHHEVDDSDRYGVERCRWSFLLRPEQGTLDLDVNRHRDSTS